MTASRALPETIIALASGPGRAGVAVVRVSGSRALDLLARLTQARIPDPRRAVTRILRIPGQDDFIDEALVISMPGPASFTGEDVVEFHLHGGPAIVEAVLAAALEGRLCRLALPGEFTRRAFENGKLDLTQAEAVADLVDAETDGQRRQAARIYQGEASRAFETWRSQLVSAMAALEASIDFPDESDIPADVSLAALVPIGSLALDLQAALGASGRLQAVREGFRIAIIGAPNAGKSSLMNRLARRDAAIVSPIPGTTRDVVEVRLVLAGFPVWFADTAGLRDASDEIEAEGIRRALARAEEADLRIWVLDAAEPETSAPGVSRETSIRPDDLIVFNKIDLNAGVSHTGWAGDTFALSARTGAGLEALEQRLTDIVRERLAADEPPLVTRARHRALVQEALGYVRRAMEAAHGGLGAELVSEDLRMAARALGRITGAVDAEDLLDRIFSDFCIGK